MGAYFNWFMRAPNTRAEIGAWIVVATSAASGCSGSTVVQMKDAGGDTMVDACVGTQTNVNHCGQCNTVCPTAVPANSVPACSAGVCGFACNEGFVQVEQGCTAIAAPRLIAPLSTSTVTSRRPNFTVALASGTNGARIEVFRDRAATMMVAAFDTTEARGAPAEDLPPGMLFWRARGRAGMRMGTQTSPVWQIVVGQRSAGVNTAWGVVPDVNGDGYGDIIVGAAAASSHGRVAVYHGGQLGIPSQPNTMLVVPTADATPEFGRAVAAAGDVNGDGFVDVIAGAPGESSGSGRAYLYLGSAQGLANTPAITILGPRTAGGRFGAAVAAAGDINGDGYGDVAIGAPGANRVFVYLGRVDLVETSPMVATPQQGELGRGTSDRDEFGAALAGACDVNGDGLADFVVGAPGSDSNKGAVHVFGGRQVSLNSTPVGTRYGFTAGSRFGSAVSCAGDTDADGYLDLVIGEPSACPADTSEPVSSVVRFFRGSPTGPLSASTDLLPSTIPGGSRVCGFGMAVSSAGDLNADGYSDIIVGAPLYGTDRGYRLGLVQLFLGGSNGIVRMPPAETLLSKDGTGDQEFGATVRGIGDLNGDGLADFAIGAPRDAGYVLVYLWDKTMNRSQLISTLNGMPADSLGASLGP